MAAGVKPPVWFWIVAILLVLWEAIGVWFCVDQFRLGAASAMWEQDPWDQALYKTLPVWYNYCYAVATFGGLLGGFALLLRERRSIILFWISEIAVVVMFGYVFTATDMIAHKGVAVAVTFPIIIALIGAFAIWFAGFAAKKGWIGR